LLSTILSTTLEQYSEEDGTRVVHDQNFLHNHSSGVLAVGRFGPSAKELRSDNKAAVVGNRDYYSRHEDNRRSW